MEVDGSVKYKAGLQLSDLECRQAGAPSPLLPASRSAPLPSPRCADLPSPPELPRAPEPGPRSHRADSAASGGGYPAASPAPYQGEVPRARSRYQQPRMPRAGSQQVRGVGTPQD